MVKAGPTVILDTEGQTFSHGGCSRGLQGRKSQERAEPCLHGPVWWRSTATTPQLSFTLRRWNPSVMQQSRALTQACQIFQLQGVCPDQSWRGSWRSLSTRESLWWPSAGSGSLIFPSLPSTRGGTRANSAVDDCLPWLMVPAGP